MTAGWRERVATPLLACVILGLNLWLNAPLFMSGELPFRGSVENGYVGMARFISQHPGVWGWNPLPYCGLPVQFMYVPGLLYAAALGMRLLPGTDPAMVYRTLTALATCLGPVTLFLFATWFTRSRSWALVAAMAYSLMSPSYGLFPAVEKDRGIVQLPWRVQVLAKYGEGPHNTGLMLLPLALMAVWAAAKKRSFASLFTAALLLAAIPLTNWVAAFALAISCLLLLLAAWGEPEFVAWRALAAAALAYLLACFWLTPNFIGIVAFNWPADSYNYKVGNQQELALGGMVLGALAIRGLFRWLRGSLYLCLVTLAAFVFGWVSTSYYLFGVDVIPESRRYAIEFELFFALALVEGLRLAFASSNSTFKLCAVATIGVTLLGGALQVNSYLTQGWDRWKPVPRESTTEFQLARWLAQHLPTGRVYATGGLRFRLHSYFDIPQVGGAFETGLRNRLPVDLSFRIRDAKNLWPGEEAEDTILELKALGAEYVVVHGPKSKEYYRDFVHPERLAAAMQAVFHMDDDTVYALPPRRIAHLLRAGEIPLIDVRDHHDVLRRYVAAIEDVARPQLGVRWVDNNTLAMTGPVREGDAVGVQVNADPGWSATQDGREIAMTRDRLGFVVLHPAAAANTRVELHFGATLEQRLMALVSALAWCVSLYWLWRTRRVA